MQGGGNLVHHRAPVTLQDEPGQLLSEQRHSIGALHDCIDELGRQRGACHHPRDHLPGVTVVEAIKRNLGVMRAHRPGRVELGPRRTEQHQRRGRCLLDQGLRKLQCGRVDPVEILHRHHRRLHPGQVEDPGRQVGQQPLAPLVGCEHQRGVFVRARQVEQLGDERHRFAKLEPRFFQPALELGQALGGTFVATPAQALLEYLGHGVKRGILGELLAGAFDPQVRFISELRAELLDQARLADARLPHHQHQLALTLARPLPAAKEQVEVIFAPHEGRQAAPRGPVRAPAHHGGLDDPIELERMLNPFKLLGTAILDHEPARDQLLHRGGNHHRVGLRGRLDPRGDVGCIAEDLGPFTAALAHDHRAGLDSDPHRKLHPVFTGQPSVQRRDLVDDRQPGTHRARGVVLVRLRPAEVHHQPVAQVLGDVPAEAGDRRGGCALILRGDRAPVFGIQASCYFGGTDQVREQHRQVAALAIGRGSGPVFPRGDGNLGGWLWRRWRLCRTVTGAQRCTAIPAEALTRWIVRTAPGTTMRHRRAAIAAESIAFGVLRFAVRTAHRG